MCDSEDARRAAAPDAMSGVVSHIAETLQGDLFNRAAEIKNANPLQG
jgi:hypothetical protein